MTGRRFNILLVGMTHQECALHSATLLAVDDYPKSKPASTGAKEALQRVEKRGSGPDSGVNWDTWLMPGIDWSHEPLEQRGATWLWGPAWKVAYALCVPGDTRKKSAFWVWCKGPSGPGGGAHYLTRALFRKKKKAE